MIQTVCGAIPKEALGVTLSHEHLLVDLRRVRHDEASVLDDLEMVSEELKPAVKLGCRSVIEVTTVDMGRDAAGLQKLSGMTGLNIIASTGFYLKEYHSDWLQQAPVDEVEEFFVKEVNVGINGADVKAGAIGEVASSERIYPSERKVLTAAAKASGRTDTAVFTHCNMGLLGLEQISLMLGQGMKPDKLVIGHTDLAADAAYQTAMLKFGVNLAFDTIGKNNYLSDDSRAEILTKLLDSGWEDHLLLSEDVSKQTYLIRCGGKGYTAVLGSFLPLLRSKGVTETQIHKLLVENPARILNR